MDKHFIGMAGQHGCLPGYCEVFDTVRDAAAALAEVHELGQDRRDRLMRNQYLELPRGSGNEYAEISQCDCSTPWVHSDNGTREDWERAHQGERS